MKTNKEKETNQYINHNIAEIPSLILRKVSGSRDFTIEEIHLESKGYDFREAKEGLDKLIKAVKKI